MTKDYNKLTGNMGFLDKILKMSEKDGSINSTTSMYEILFSKIEYSIKSSNPSMEQKELFAKTKEVYLAMCKCLDCKCIDDVYKPINKAISKALSNKNQY
ncbi:MAG: hypothetical protein ACP5MV_04635 [Candidatus Parvarchaeum sp.]